MLGIPADNSRRTRVLKESDSLGLTADCAGAPDASTNVTSDAAGLRIGF